MPTFRHGLCKLGDYYQYCFRIEGRQFKGSTRATDRTTAEKVLREKRREAVLQIQTGYVEPPTVSELVRQWVIAHTQTLSPNHVLNTQRLAGKWVLPTMGEVRIDRVTTSMVLGIRSRMLESGLKLPTANLLFRTIKLLWNFAVKMGWIERLPFQAAQLRVQKKPRQVVPAPRVSEFLATVDEITEDTQKRLAIRFALFCGMRISEVMTMRYEWLDRSRHLYTVGKAKGKEARVVPIPEWLWVQLASLPKTLSPWLFPGPNGKPRSRVYLNQTLELAAKQMGLGTLTPHRLRGSFATLHAEAGTPITDIQGLMGHKDITTTIGYVEQTLEAKRRAQDALSIRLGLA